jgi:hypothetical protein
MVWFEGLGGVIDREVEWRERERERYTKGGGVSG